MSRELVDAVGIVASLGLATGGYEIQRSHHATGGDPPPGELFHIPTLLKAAGEFLMWGGVLLALLLAGILIAAR